MRAALFTLAGCSFFYLCNNYHMKQSFKPFLSLTILGAFLLFGVGCAPAEESDYYPATADKLKIVTVEEDVSYTVMTFFQYDVPNFRAIYMSDYHPEDISEARSIGREMHSAEKEFFSEKNEELLQLFELPNAYRIDVSDYASCAFFQYENYEMVKADLSIIRSLCEEPFIEHIYVEPNVLKIA